MEASYKRVYQTKFGDGVGNCHQACLATFFGQELHQVPDFVNKYGGDLWFDKMNQWCERKHNVKFFYLPLKVKGKFKNDRLKTINVPSIWLVQSPSGVRHNVIGKRCRVLHDPCKPGKKVTAKLVIGVHIPMMINYLFEIK